MMNKEHLTPDRIKALKEGTLSKKEEICALEHIGECLLCAVALAESYSDPELFNLPPGFKAVVFSAIDKENINKIVKEKDIAGNRKRELFRYSFKVSIAACIALILLFSGTINYGLDISRSFNTGLSGVNVVTENLRGFSDKLIDFEGTKNLKEEL